MGRAHVSRALPAVLLLFASAAFAQVESDTVPFGRVVLPQEEIEREMAGARWKLGPVRLIPQLFVRNAGYDSNVLGAPEDSPEVISDWTATVAAGVRLLLPMGGKVFLRADLVPEYTWYAELEERRLLQGRYGLGLFAFFNRLHFDVAAYNNDSTGYLNSEVQALVRTEARGASSDVEIEVLRNVSLWAGGRFQESRYEPLDDLPLEVDDPSELDRDAWGLRGGVRYGFRRDLKVSLGVEKTETEFVNRPLSDYETTAWLVGVSLDRKSFYVNAIGGQRHGKPLPGSTFPEYDEFTGSGFVTVPISRFELRVYGRRGILPSIDPDAVYYLETRGGLGVRVPIISRVSIQAYGEVGDNEYPEHVVGGQTIPGRRDRIEAYGGGLQLVATDALSVDVLGYRTVTEPGAGGEPSAVFRLITNLTIGVLFP
jgi:hypothetical protein